ncbi:uncharacterized protein LOC133310376 [Gastrolobium bilobum]|uniref:uncharacterized protein LOC133310376 n=1 Tax=Gastrolobium bilobum TaxID=150636 RepID=UPI002AB08BC5|nr:uncharacterized protein LOC133310376 [Gastrolobium bilobum]
MYQGALKKNKLPARSFDIHSGTIRDDTIHDSHQNKCVAVETGVSSAEKGITSSVKSITEAPSSSFEFYVRSEEGINLHVDLNWSPSDWTNRFRNEVCASENVFRKESRSLWQHIGCLGECSTRGESSFLWNINSGQIDDHNGQTKSSSNLKLAKDVVTGLDQQNKGGSPSIYDSLTPCSITINDAKNVKENQSTVSAEVSYGAANNYISGSESCAKDASKKILDSDATDTPFIKSICGSVDMSLSDPDTLKRQKSKPDNEISEDCVMLNGSCSVNAGMMCPEASLSGSLELPISEVANDPRNTFDAKLDRLVNSSKINLDTDGKNLPSLTEEWLEGFPFVSDFIWLNH